jgi:GNAT superfamily N-acetyltransferase
VVVRRVVGTRAGRPLFSDALGLLTEFTETHLTVVTAAGPVRIPLADVRRAKRVPPRRRPSGREVVALELAADEAWPAPTTERLGEWRLRAAAGWTGRANSALPAGDPGLPLDAAIDAVAGWYARHGLNPMINVPLPFAARLDAALAARGWPHRPVTLVQTAGLPELAAAAPARTGLPAVRLSEAPSPAWLALAAGRKGGLPAAARHILTAVRRLRFAEVYADGGDLLAIARGTVTSDWFGVSLIEVVPEARRRGLAQHVVGALARWAGEAGANRAYLQVEERNTAAVSLYARLGFSTHHRYLTRYAPPAAT